MVTGRSRTASGLLMNTFPFTSHILKKTACQLVALWLNLFRLEQLDSRRSLIEALSSLAFTG